MSQLLVRSEVYLWFLAQTIPYRYSFVSGTAIQIPKVVLFMGRINLV
jgi:hypothetical protein